MNNYTIVYENWGGTSIDFHYGTTLVEARLAFERVKKNDHSEAKLYVEVTTYEDSEEGAKGDRTD
jgi:hypothetical protein